MIFVLRMAWRRLLRVSCVQRAVRQRYLVSAHAYLVVLVRAVRKVEASHAHARHEQLLNHLHAA